MTDKTINRLAEGMSGKTGEDIGASLSAAIRGAALDGQRDLSTVFQQATKQIGQLTATTQVQAEYLLSNTQALGQNTVSKSSSSGVSGGIASALSGAASGLLGDTLSLLPLISGIAKLFGGGPSQPEPLMRYIAPAPIQFRDAVNTDSQSSTADRFDAAGGSGGSRPAAQQSNQAITIQVNAMDSKSFMDHSHDIAHAVREAMLNMHSINDVVNDL